ncbi:MAG: PP2C family protein-serine/threonine phosphatase, partial [Bacteroidota bacterium]
FISLGWEMSLFEIREFIYKNITGHYKDKTDCLDMAILIFKRLNIEHISLEVLIDKYSNIIDLSYISNNDEEYPQKIKSIVEFNNQDDIPFVWLGQFAFYNSLKNRIESINDRDFFLNYIRNRAYEISINKLELSNLNWESKIIYKLFKNNIDIEPHNFINELSKYIIDRDTIHRNEYGKIIVEKSVELAESLDAAKNLFFSMLPAKNSFEGYFSEVQIIFLPYSEIGGDFYYANYRNNSFLFFAGDCEGHGIRGALTAISTDRIIEDTTLAQPNSSCIDLVKQIYYNRILHTLKYDDKKRELIQDLINGFYGNYHQKMANDELINDVKSIPKIDAFDCSLFEINFSTKKITFSGVNQIIYYRNNDLNEIIETYKAVDSIVESIFQGKFNVKDEVRELTVGTIIIIFSDGIYSQFGGRKQKPLQKNKLINVINILLDLTNENLNDFSNLLSAFIIFWRDTDYFNLQSEFWDIKGRFDCPNEIEEILTLIKFQYLSKIFKLENIKKYSINQFDQTDDISVYCFKI